MEFKKENITYKDILYDFYVEIGGGLGDCIRWVFCGGVLYFIENVLKPHEKLLITIVSHNPTSISLFDKYKNMSNITILNCGYWISNCDGEKRNKFGLPNGGSSFTIDCSTNYFITRRNKLPHKYDLINFNTISDAHYLNILHEKKYVVLSTKASLSERTIPANIVNKVIEILQKKYGIFIVYIGNNYKHIGNAGSENPNETSTTNFFAVTDSVTNYNIDNNLLLDLVDKVSTGTVIEIIKKSVGIIVPHSSLFMVAWTYYKPCFLIYPTPIIDRFIVHSNEDPFYNEGLNWSTTVHCSFEQFNDSYVEKFNQVINPIHVVNHVAPDIARASVVNNIAKPINKMKYLRAYAPKKTNKRRT